MKLATLVIATKGACYLIIGIATPLAASLAQWANSGTWPERIVWMGVVLPACLIGGATQLLAFLSKSFGSYQEERSNTRSEQPNSRIAT